MDVEILFFTEFSNTALLAANIIEKTIKTAMFVENEASAPLYEEKSTTVESTTTMVAKIRMKTSEVFLLKIIVLIVSSFMAIEVRCIKTSRV
ncbi:MAG TPA: hypothetical protein VJ729_14805 [Nitrososphaeraceae archaeon]|nr:hypothetical protein [Nitrososphaeraceae archaeon]